MILRPRAGLLSVWGFPVSKTVYRSRVYARGTFLQAGLESRGLVGREDAMHRLLAKKSMVVMTAIVMGYAGISARAQRVEGGTSPVAAGAAQTYVTFPGKAELLRQIALYEDAERSSERTNPGMDSMVKVYQNLAGLYEAAEMYPQAEDQMRRAISLLRSGPQGELAEAMGHLAVLHIAMGDLHAAEKDELETLRVRESVGDPVGTALTWSDLADVYIKQRHYKQALDYAQRAMAVLADDPKVEVAGRISVRQTLAYALCGLKQCAQAIPLLKEAIELEKRAYGDDSLTVGTGYFILGYNAWQCGDMADAAAWMQRGTARMKADRGWGHSIYVNAMSQYARFLRQSGQTEQAAAAQREVRQALSVVDARTLTASQSTFAAGPR